MKYLIITVTLLVASSILAEEPQVLIEAFFEDLAEKRYEKAVDSLTSIMPESPKKAKVNLQLKSNFKSLPNAVGRYYGSELVSEKKVGESFVALAYLALYEKEAMRLEFVFYKPDDSWRLSTLKMADFDANDMISLLRAEDGYDPKNEASK